MALTPTIKVAGAVVRSALRISADDVNIGGAVVRSIIGYPAQSLPVSQAVLRTVREADVDLRVTQTVVRAIVRGRVYDPYVRIWTFTLDEHDYIVVRLQDDATLVCDIFGDQVEFYTWASGDGPMWRAFTGTNWYGAGAQHALGSNIVVGDDGIGTLYILDPDGAQDDDAREGSDIRRDFKRVITAQMAFRGYGSVPMYGLQLLGSIGQDTTADALGIQLEISDDRGASYVDCGTVDVTAGETATRVNWRSLGSMKAPGRLFRITDYSLQRIDNLETEGEDDASQ